MILTVLGCSDAFGSGGRLQTSFHVAHSVGEFLIDCGATTLIGLERQSLDPNRIDSIFITHLHGDHFGGLVWWLIHAIYAVKRTAPLTVAGPAGLEARFITAAEALFPGSSLTPRPFALTFIEYATDTTVQVGAVRVTPFEVSHPSGATPYALRIETGGRTLAFSGDTEWVETLIPASASADLFITECYAFDKPTRYHMSWRTIELNLPRITAHRILLTHMGQSMLASRAEVIHPRVLLAEDGLRLEV
jgi:ribonuclease BN (tRNA processing enzyme)